MRGQKLFIRAMDGADAETVGEFLRRESPTSPMPETALLGKLAGDLVAVLAMELTDESVGIRNLVVAQELRRKRIGRFMIDEVAVLAEKMDRRSVTLQCEAPRGFLERVGFTEVSGVMVRRVAE
jgi:N-acetylglutamate synthase-like GNAT family acetyltransferase